MAMNTQLEHGSKETTYVALNTQSIYVGIWSIMSHKALKIHSEGVRVL